LLVIVEEEILEHNLYGVDINEDAVEIAKLSLWLRTAKRGRPLTKLADKIVCANSLLNMPFSENSFDVVIGNPPYVRQEAIKEQKEALSKIYKVANGTADLYVYFYELALNMLKPNGLKGFICSNKFFRAKYGENLREYILQNTTILQIADFNGVKIFEDATVDSAITIFQKTKSDNNSTFKVVNVI
jgi:type II restriction/modification system DNA methylase subunit YeeA